MHLKIKKMKGILPNQCKTIGYVILACSIFLPAILYIMGYINDSNFMLAKATIKVLIWFALFMIFLAKTKNENEETSAIRIKSSCYALYFIFIYYIIMLVKGLYEGNLNGADSSALIVFMTFNVICLEFGIKKTKIDKLFKK